MSEEITSQQYIRISQSDFKDVSFMRSDDSYFRSLESYLRKNSRSYKIEGKTCTIDVHDQNDAMILGLHFGFHQVEYFNGLKSLLLILIDTEKKLSGSRRMLFDSMRNKTTLRKVREESLREVKLHCLDKNEVIKKGILTKKELGSAIANGSLIPINIGTKCYIDKQELITFIKSNQ